MKDKIINQIIHELVPLRTLYPEIDIITNDLLNNKLDTLKEFLDKNYQDTNINPDLKNLIISLVNEGKLNNSYLEILNIENIKPTEVDLIKFLNSVLIGYKAIDLKNESFKKLITNLQTGYSNSNITLIDNKTIETDYTKFSPISDYEFPNTQEHPKLTPSIEDEIHNTDMVLNHPKLTPIDIENNDIPTVKEEHPKLNLENVEIEYLEETYIEKLRKSIMEAQLNYLNNANSFIEELENKSEAEIYQKLLSLNDIRYNHHSISKLSNDTLNRLLPYITNLVNSNNHSSINIFIEESIKKSLHQNKKM